jgi:acetylornithine deacetylase/succinyl-diaminopimelate desuccinylase-like protein
MAQSWQAYLTEQNERFEAELVDLLRIPSLSTDPAHRAEVRRAAGWVAARMDAAGIEHAAIMETAGHPVVYGDWLHAPGRPTVLIYGHYDVQPADPLDLWTTPPFEPSVRDGRIYARGASDMKGNLLLPLIACEALLKTEGALPVNVKFLFEGEEEVGSPNLAPFIAAHRDLLACDMAINADSGQFSEEQPAVLVGLRGLIGVQIDVRSAGTDLHSGLMGGIAPNAIAALTQIIGALKRPDGTIAIEGFYDEVRPLTPEEKEAIARIPDATAAMAQQAGIKAPVGEPGFTPQERNWVRPTLDVNGIWGGYQGEGIKTVIPCEAHAKVTCRLVPDQQPETALEQLTAAIRRAAPPEVEVTVTPLPGQGRPYLIPADHPGMAAAERALTALYGKAPHPMRMGASVPVTAIFQQVLDIYTVGFGFALFDERMHAPNEFLRLSSFAKGQTGFCLLLTELAR